MTSDDQRQPNDGSPAFGAAISSEHVTGASIDRESAAVISTDSRKLPENAERWQAAAIIRGMSGAAADRRIVAAAPDDAFDWLEVNGLFASDEVVDGVRFIPATSAVLSAAWIDGHLDGASVVAVVDIGSSGVDTAIVDIDNGRVLRRASVDDFGGDVADEAVTRYLIDTYGAAELLDDDVIDRLRSDVRVAREWLSEDQMVDLDGPFVNSPVRVRRTMLEDVLEPNLHRLTADIHDTLFGRSIDSVVLVGGLAAMPAVVDAVAAGVDAPTVVPGPHARERGAAWIAAQDDAAIEPAMHASGAIPVASRSGLDTDRFAAVSAAPSGPAKMSGPAKTSKSSDRPRGRRLALVVGAAIASVVVLVGAAWGVFDRSSVADDLDQGDGNASVLEASVGTSPSVPSSTEVTSANVPPELAVPATAVPVSSVQVPVVPVEPSVTPPPMTTSQPPAAEAPAAEAPTAETTTRTPRTKTTTAETTTVRATTTTADPTTTTRRNNSGGGSDRDPDTSTQPRPAAPNAPGEPTVP